MKNCELNDDKLCNDCGECDICDVDKNKICDNCCICIGLDSETEYKIVEIEDLDDGIDYDFTEEEEQTFIDWSSRKTDK